MSIFDQIMEHEKTHGTLSGSMESITNEDIEMYGDQPMTLVMEAVDDVIEQLTSAHEMDMSLEAHYMSEALKGNISLESAIDKYEAAYEAATTKHGTTMKEADAGNLLDNIEKTITKASAIVTNSWITASKHNKNMLLVKEAKAKNPSGTIDIKTIKRDDSVKKNINDLLSEMQKILQYKESDFADPMGKLVKAPKEAAVPILDARKKYVVGKSTVNLNKSAVGKAEKEMNTAYAENQYYLNILEKVSVNTNAMVNARKNTIKSIKQNSDPTKKRTLIRNYRKLTIRYNLLYNALIRAVLAGMNVEKMTYNNSLKVITAVAKQKEAATESTTLSFADIIGGL